MSGLAEVEHYRKKSAQAERKAAAAKDPSVQQRFVRIAARWRALAEDTQQWISFRNPRAQHHELRYARRHPF